MRIAVLVIALGLTMIVGLQSCAVTVGGNLGQDRNMSGAGASGVLLALLYLLGAAFVMGLPRVSMVLFGLAAVIGLGVGFGSQFVDMRYWGGVGAVLAIMSYFGWLELRRQAAQRQATTPAAQPNLAQRPGEQP